MGLYDEEVDCWLVNHNAFFLFFWGLFITLGALFLMPFEIYWNIRDKFRRLGMK